MNRYDDDDLPGSPENVFRRCPFSGKRISGDSDSDSSDSEAFPVESTGIFMLSLPDSLEEKDDCTSHLYQTAPEEFAPAEAIGAEMRPGCVDDEKTVDLGRDTDVGLYSEVQSIAEFGEKVKSIEVASVCRSLSSEATKSGLRFDESVVSLGESSSKKIRLSEEGMFSISCARTLFDKFPVDTVNSGGIAKLLLASSVSHNNGDEDSGGKCKSKRMDGKDSNGENDGIHCNYIEKSAEKEESRKNSQSHQHSKLQEEIANGHQLSYRVLPSSFNGMKKNAAEKKFNTSEDHHPIDLTLLEILKVFKGEEEREIDIDDQGLSKLDILDMVQRCGMTFPRPQWWPPEV